MLTLHLGRPAHRPLSVLAIGAHPDDIEIGAGGTLLTLAASQPGLRVNYVVLTGSAERQLEARRAADAFLQGAEVAVRLHELPEGRLPAAWREVKDTLEQVGSEGMPDLVIAPTPGDAHQDHRTIAEIVPTVFRDQLTLGYEIPKWDGDLGTPNCYVRLPDAVVEEKIRAICETFISQRSKHWFTPDTFRALMRLRGVEANAPFAEAFYARKLALA
jgi:LmbE family N-acetylglucosaminyl deacetylase